MSQWITLRLPQGSVTAWQAIPSNTPRGGLVVIQEIFGANAHIRDVANRYAAEGYLAIAPAFFDLIKPGIELPYDQSGLQRGRELVQHIGMDSAIKIVAAAAQAARTPNVGTVGYCWGGSVALRSAQALGLPGISYYGARNIQFLETPLRAPVQFHFGEHDSFIPMDAVEQQRQAWPSLDVFTYPAGHAFNRDTDPQHYDAPSAKLAWQRSLEFLRAHVG